MKAKNVISTLTPDLRVQYRREGFLLLRDVFDYETIVSLDQIIQNLIERALAGHLKMKWMDKARALPKPRVQFDGLIDCHSKIYEPYCHQWLFNEVIPIAKFLLTGKVHCTGFGMLFHGVGYRAEPKNGGWHRDGGGVSKSPYTAENLGYDALRSCSFHAPLKPQDDFHQLVPGTHIQRSKAEIEDPIRFEVPKHNVVTLELCPGDLLLRHAKILHRGFPQSSRLRRTYIGDFWRTE